MNNSFASLVKKHYPHISLNPKSSDHHLYLQLLGEQMVEESHLHVLFAKSIDCQSLPLKLSTKYPQHLKEIFSYTFLKSKSFLPLQDPSGNYLVLLSSFEDIDNLNYVSFILQSPFSIYFCPHSQLLDKLKHIYSENNSQKASSQSITSQSENQGFDLIGEDKQSLPLLHLNQILKEAIEIKASDIHLEMHEKHFQVRFRIDGSLIIKYRFSQSIGQEITNRLKIMATFDLAKHLTPQDGQFKVITGSESFDIRISLTPTIYGERIVLRVLERNNPYLDIKTLNPPSYIQKFLLSSIERTGGMLLVTGPTGSGKTTTLYSALSTLDPEKRNIMTIEDPVEYHLPLASQISINPKVGYTFSTGLKHILRQDPDIILLGEIRDSETAKIALQASLTGHLVLSTLHTKNAPSAITRLLELGIEPYLIASTLVGVIHQRLVRKNCPKCFSSPKSRKKTPGCKSCNFTGFKGRTALFELLAITPQLQEHIMQKKPLKDYVDRQEKSYFPLKKHGKTLVDQGILSPEELLRITLDK